MRSLIILVVVVSAIIGPSMVIGRIGAASIQALGRNPTSAPKILMAMVMALIFVEALAIVALLMFFQVIGSG